MYGLHADRTYTPSANGADYWTLSPSVRWKPAPRFVVQAGPTLQRVIEDAQYVKKAPAAGEAPADFGGLRYVFARMDQTTIGAEVRLNVSCTRNLTLQTYVQPLISAARYSISRSWPARDRMSSCTTGGTRTARWRTASWTRAAAARPSR